MSGASAFFILIPAMYLLFTVAMSVMALVDRRLVAARWAAAGFFVAFVSILVDGFRAPTDATWTAWFTITTHFLPLLIMVQAFLSRHGERVPLTGIVLAVGGSVLLMPDAPWFPPFEVRRPLVQGICAAIIACGLPGLWRVRGKSAVDLIAFIVISAAAASYFFRFAFTALNPGGNSAEEMAAFYHGLNIVLHSASALMGMSVGIVLMMTIGNDMLRGRIEESEIDPLTGVGNRRRFDRAIDEDASIGGVLVVDLDHFKKINDAFGHDAGDDVLRAVGAKLRHLFAELGCVCRTGGEEFVVLVPQDHSESLAQLGISARMAIAGLTFDGPLSQVRVTASVGFHHRDPAQPVREAVQRADQAVYCAKTDGRDRVVGAVVEHGLQVLKAVA